ICGFDTIATTIDSREEEPEPPQPARVAAPSPARPAPSADRRLGPAGGAGGAAEGGVRLGGGGGWLPMRCSPVNISATGAHRRAHHRGGRTRRRTVVRSNERGRLSTEAESRRISSDEQPSVHR